MLYFGKVCNICITKLFQCTGECMNSMLCGRYNYACFHELVHNYTNMYFAAYMSAQEWSVGPTARLAVNAHCLLPCTRSTVTPVLWRLV